MLVSLWAVLLAYSESSDPTTGAEARRSQMENQKRETYVNPTKQRDILRHYKEYKNCPERLTALKEILSHCDDKEMILADKEFSRITQNLLTEVNNATGCRPVALTKLTVSHWIDKSPTLMHLRHSLTNAVISSSLPGNWKL